MGFASDDEHKPAKTDAKFYNEADALKYARDWVDHEAIVEYGVQRLEDV